MKNLQGYFDALLEDTSSSFHRYMFSRIDWDSRLIGLVGPRGVGKTTLMLQHAKRNYHVIVRFLLPQKICILHPTIW